MTASTAKNVRVAAGSRARGRTASTGARADHYDRQHGDEQRSAGAAAPERDSVRADHEHDQGLGGK